MISCWGKPVNEKIVCLPVGLGYPFNSSLKNKNDLVIKKYHLPKKYILYPANPWPHKNHSRLFAALKIFRDQHGFAPTLVLSGHLINESRVHRILHQPGEKAFPLP